MRTVEIDPAKMGGPTDDGGSGERAQPSNHANRESESQYQRSAHGEKLSRNRWKIKARGGKRADESAEKKRGPGLGSKAPKVAFR